MFEFFTKFIHLFRVAYHADGFLNWAENSGSGLTACPHIHTSHEGPSSRTMPAKSVSSCHTEG